MRGEKESPGSRQTTGALRKLDRQKDTRQQLRLNSIMLHLRQASWEISDAPDRPKSRYSRLLCALIADCLGVAARIEKEVR